MILEAIWPNHVSQISIQTSIVCMYVCMFVCMHVLFLERGDRRKRRREISIGCLSHAPIWGPGPQPRHVPRLAIQLVTFWFAGWRSIHWATLARAHLNCFRRWKALATCRNLFPYLVNILALLVVKEIIAVAPSVPMWPLDHRRKLIGLA